MKNDFFELPLVSLHYSRPQKCIFEFPPSFSALFYAAEVTIAMSLVWDMGCRDKYALFGFEVT